MYAEPIDPNWVVWALLIFAAVATAALFVYCAVGAVIDWQARRHARVQARRVAAARACRVGEFTDRRALGWDRPRPPRGDERYARRHLYTEPTAVLKVDNETRPAA